MKSEKITDNSKQQIDLNQLKQRFIRQQKLAGEALKRLIELASRRSAKKLSPDKVHRAARRVQVERRKLDEATTILLEIDSELKRHDNAGL